MKTLSSGQTLINLLVFSFMVSLFMAKTLRNLSPGLPPQWRKPDHVEPCLSLLLLPNLHVVFLIILLLPDELASCHLCLLKWYLCFTFFKISRSHCVACGILVPWPGVGLVPSALEVWSLNHWTPREVPTTPLLINSEAFPNHPDWMITPFAVHASSY